MYVFTLQIPLKEGIGGERRPKDRVNLQITLIPYHLTLRSVSSLNNPEENSDLNFCENMKLTC
jgi:hypothetical protein